MAALLPVPISGVRKLPVETNRTLEHTLAGHAQGIPVRARREYVSMPGKTPFPAHSLDLEKRSGRGESVECRGGVRSRGVGNTQLCGLNRGLCAREDEKKKQETAADDTVWKEGDLGIGGASEAASELVGRDLAELGPAPAPIRKLVSSRGWWPVSAGSHVAVYGYCMPNLQKMFVLALVVAEEAMNSTVPSGSI